MVSEGVADLEQNVVAARVHVRGGYVLPWACFGGWRRVGREFRKEDGVFASPVRLISSPMRTNIHANILLYVIRAGVWYGLASFSETLATTSEWGLVPRSLEYWG